MMSEISIYTTTMKFQSKIKHLLSPGEYEIWKKYRRRVSSRKDYLKNKTDYLARAKKHNEEKKAKGEQFHKTPEGKAYFKSYRQTKKFKEQQKVYRKSPKGIAQYEKTDYKEWRKDYEQTPEFKAKQKASRERRLKTDPLYASKCILRRAVTHAFKRIGKNKPANTQTLLGCDWEHAKAHIESLFKEGMTWDNHGMYGWHIDHIRPVSSFKEDEIHLMNHISNLQPLWADENWEKGSKIL